MKNRDRIIEYLPRLASAVESAVGEGALAVTLVHQYLAAHTATTV